MKILTHCICLGAMLFASSAAFANPLTGTLTIDGGYGSITPATLDSGTTSITFKAGDEATFFGAGAFSGAGISFVPFTSPFAFTTGPMFPGSILFSITDSFGLDSFTVDQVLTGSNGSLTFYGTLADGAVGTFILTPNTSEDGSFSGTLTSAATPEPASLVLLGTGLAGAAGLIIRKRKVAVKK